MADKDFNVSTVFTADISNFQKSTQDMQKYIKLVNSEFKAAVGGSKDFEKSADGLKTKIEQLSRVLKAEEQILKNKEANLDKLKKKYGENSKEVQDYTVQVNNQKAKIKDIQRSIEKYSKSLDEMGDEAKKGAKAQKDLEDATKKMGDGFTVAKGAIAGFIANGLTALAGAAKNAVSSVLGLADATREYRQTLATLETASDSAGVNADVMKDKFTDLMGVFNDQDSVTEGLNNLLAGGFDEKNIDQITQQLEGAALKWKDTLKFEGLADGLQETLATGSAIGPFAEMLERSGVNLDKFDEGLAKATTEAEKQKYVLDELSKLGLAEVSEAYREQNAQMIEAQQANVDYQNAVAAMGEKLEPVTTKIREGFTKILEKMLELLEGVDLEAFAEMIESAFDSFINDILPKIINGLQWIIDNKEPILATIIAIGAAFLAWKVVGVVTSVIKAIKNMTTAMKALNAVMKANVIGIVISAIAALVAAFIYLWNNCEGFRKFWQNLWENIKNIAGKAWEAIKGFFVGAWNAIKSVWNGVTDFFSGLWDGIKNGAKACINGVISAFETGLNAVIGFINSLTGGLSGLWDWAGIPAIPKIPTVNIPRLAKGAVVDKATLAMIGEAGKEAVVPLERNTQGLRKMAGMVAEELKTSGLGNTNVTYNNTFTNMPTTRYAMKKAMADSAGMYQLYKTIQGGV